MQMSTSITAGAGRATYASLQQRVRELEEKLALAMDTIHVMSEHICDPTGRCPPALQEYLTERSGWCVPCADVCQNLEKYCVNHCRRLKDCDECACDGTNNEVLHSEDTVEDQWRNGVCVFCRGQECAVANAHGIPLKRCWPCHLESEDVHTMLPNDVFTLPVTATVAESGGVKRKCETDTSLDGDQAKK